MKSEETIDNSIKQVKPGKEFFIGLLVFAFTLIVTMAIHAGSELPHRTLCFDARQYFSDTCAVSEFVLALFHGHWQPQLLTNQAFLTSILSDGPAFPTFWGLLLSFTGHVPGIQDCRLIEVIQSIIHSLSAVLVYTLSLGFCRRRIPSTCAGLAWGVYPAAVFWSAIFYTETTVIFFSLLFVSCLAMSRRLALGFAAGLLAGIVALLKPALLPAAAVASLLSFRQNKRAFVALMLGTTIALAPWAIYTKAMTGKACFTAQRFPAFNLAMGSDTEVDACLVSPAPPLTTMFSHDDAMPFAFPLAQWEFHTTDLLRLSLVKLSALWSRQSNDFRQKFVFLDPAAQNVWHLLLLCLGIAGAFCYISTLRSSKQSTEQTIALASLIFIGTHFCYILFTPAARYGMTSMPFFVIFAAFALQQYSCSSQRLRIAACTAVSALLVLGLVSATSLSEIFQMDEVVHKLAPGEVAIKHIEFSSSNKAASSISSVLLLVDGDEGLEHASVEVNGHLLTDHLQHIRNFNSTLYLQSFELRSLGYPEGISTDEFRHWRAVSVPAEWINWTGANEFRLCDADSSCVIYGDSSSKRTMSAIDYFSVNTLCNSDKSLDLRIPSPILTGNVNEVSSLKKSVNGGGNSSSLSGDGTKCSDSLRMRLAVTIGDPPKLTNVSAEPICAAGINPKQFDIYIQDPVVNGVRANRVNLKIARSMGTIVDLPEITGSPILHVHIEGDLRGTGTKNAELVAALQPAVQSPALVLNLSPEKIPVQNEWRHFVLDDLVPSKLLAPNKKHSLYVAVYPGPWLDSCGYVADKHCGDVQFRNIKYEIRGADGPDIANKRSLFY